MPEFSLLVTIAFRKAGAQPPVYLAGTFSDPPWQPREMQLAVDGAGEHCFTAQVPVQPGLEYRYKFRAGEGDDWVLDEPSSIVTDDQGNKTNLLKVPVMDRPLEQRKSSPELLPRATVSARCKACPANVADTSNGARSGTPIAIVSATAAEVADTAAQPDNPTNTTVPRPYKLQDVGDAASDHGNFQSPLFAHEAFGASETADDGFDHEPHDFAVTNTSSGLSSGDYGVVRVDIDDPTLEKFPSERSSVLDALRRIQSGHDDNQPHTEYLQLSPRTAPLRGGFADSPDGSVALGSGRRQGRLSHGSLWPTRLAVSLGSIAEEPKAGDDFTEPASQKDKTSSTDEDEMLMMRTIKA